MSIPAPIADTISTAFAPTIQPVPALVPPADSATAPDSTDVSRAMDWLSDALNVNLDEVTVETLTVALVEYKTTQVVDDGGVIQNVQQSYVRHAQIGTFVPMRIFNDMVRRQQAAKGQGPDAALAMMGDLVLAVWKLSEPDMTLDRLVDGLGWRKVQGLFARFFKDELATTTAAKA